MKPHELKRIKPNGDTDLHSKYIYEIKQTKAYLDSVLKNYLKQRDQFMKRNITINDLQIAENSVNDAQSNYEKCLEKFKKELS
jgi:hypothetical protein